MASFGAAGIPPELALFRPDGRAGRVGRMIALCRIKSTPCCLLTSLVPSPSRGQGIGGSNSQERGRRDTTKDASPAIDNSSARRDRRPTWRRSRRPLKSTCQITSSLTIEPPSHPVPPIRSPPRARRRRSERVARGKPGPYCGGLHSLQSSKGALDAGNHTLQGHGTCHPAVAGKNGSAGEACYDNTNRLARPESSKGACRGASHPSRTRGVSTRRPSAMLAVGSMTRHRSDGLTSRVCVIL